MDERMPLAATQAELAATQAELVSIVAGSRDAIIGMSVSGTITSFNAAATVLYGYQPAGIIGRPVEMLVPVIRRADEAAVLRRVVAGEAVERYRTDRCPCGGGLVTVWMTISPILDADGVVTAVTTISHQVEDEQQGARDRVQSVAPYPGPGSGVPPDGASLQSLHEQDQFQLWIDAARVRESVQVQVRDAQDQARNRQHAQLQQSQRLEVLGQLAGGVAHDFNNLLAVILNYASFVSEELDAGPDADFRAANRDVGQITRAAERATALTHQLLAFARREIVKPTVLNLNEVVLQVQQLLERTIGEDVVLHTRLADDLWPILADTGQLEQVLVNLAVNARDAMPSGGTLRIQTENLTVSADSVTTGPPRSHRCIRLRVGDTGSGMPADVAERVFEPFFTTKTDGSGTGLGLATVFGIVTQTGGSIRLHSVPGIGTTFTIILPVTDQVAVPAPEASSLDRAFRGGTILVVEDEEALREVTERIFKRSGYRVLTAANGPEALALAANYDGDIDLLVTDVVMPHMLGKEVAERIRAMRPDTDVLYMSGYAQPVLASQGRLDRDVHLIEKPFSATTLVKAVALILNGHGVSPDTEAAADR